MSGHSKWSTIKHKKGAADAKRGQLFSKLARAIIVAAREGGADPDANLALQNAVEKARAASMPKDNIERAIARGAGTDTDAAAYEQVLYEGYGPGGVAVLVDALTDNRNRTASDVRHIFAKNDGNLGATGAVAWQFERRGVFVVTTAPDELAAVRDALAAAGYVHESAELTMVPKNTVVVDEESQARKLLRLMDALEDNEDVQGAYANFDIPESVLLAAAG
jgi:transcriptional/translational regulatory protein YebC/TACO1